MKYRWFSVPNTINKYFRALITAHPGVTPQRISWCTDTIRWRLTVLVVLSAFLWLTPQMPEIILLLLAIFVETNLVSQVRWILFKFGQNIWLYVHESWISFFYILHHSDLVLVYYLFNLWTFKVLLTPTMSYTFVSLERSRKFGFSWCTPSLTQPSTTIQMDHLTDLNHPSPTSSSQRPR